MPATSHLPKQPIQEQIAELNRKIALLDGDRKAYYESSQWTMKKNRELVSQLRQENKQLHKLKADAVAMDDKVLNEAFHNRNVERAALRGKSGKQAITIVDHKVCDTIKRLNDLRHKTEVKQKKLAELQTQHDQMITDASAAQEMSTGESEDAQKGRQGSARRATDQTLRQLENRLDKMMLKCQEAEHIRKTYQQIKVHLGKEGLTYANQLDALEAEILRARSELTELKAMNNDAQLARDAARGELSKHEEQVLRERRERETALNEYKKLAEEKKAHAERVERRMQRASLQQEELQQEQQKQQMTLEEQERKITTYEEAFRHIKEATGVSDTQEVVARFMSQGDTQRHLEELKRENEKQLSRLKEEKEHLQAEFEDMKYSGEAKLSSGQRMLEEMQSHLDGEEARRDEAQDKLERASHILVSVKSGVEHLADKLQHIKAAKGHVPTAKISPTSDEYVLDLLSISEEKLLKLMEELDGKDLQDIIRQMEEEEFHASIETKVPSHNTRIKLPQTQKQGDIYQDDEDSGDDEDSTLTRQQLKRQAQQIVDSKTRKRTKPRKKKGKQ
ncbi:coiled-coil domain-containing protein 151-like isoform X2 [Branchiostoma floridae]|uniref:Coiled-coil domain-containing protein 151-like isoform X1 n=1 Tax=Branchiostoma floridae TaxID=7739 RepID=A0A9J7LLM5_BRAFL|nr:coiled-coil domain-containing protein 151-like isoform X1 [Branchiostoma floridae]XP_035683995.1 coiled-coil domain-containing protein 151-like isoform X2 [Branchiostoma floridae]